MSYAVLICCLAAVGCVEKTRRLSKSEREVLKQIILKSEPQPTKPLRVSFGSKVDLLGYDLDRDEIQPGHPFTITWYWKVRKPLGEGWRVFTHVADSTKQSRLNLDANRPVRKLHPAKAWEAGQYIRDPQEVTLPRDWDSDKAIFYVGFWKNDERLPVGGPLNDGQNRAQVAELSVSSEEAPPPEEKPVPRLIARKLGEPLTLDGKFGEHDWLAAETTKPFVSTMTGEDGSFAVTAKLAYDADNLYVGFRVEDDFLKSEFDNLDDHLWEQDTVELMVDPDGDGKNYFEIQVAPSGVVFDTRYDSRRRPLPFGDLEWNSGTTAGVLLNGTLNDDAADLGYSVELAVPWHAFAAGPTPAEPPKAGDSWRINMYVMDATGNSQRAVGWSPPLVGDFHVPDRFGRVIFPRDAAELELRSPTSDLPVGR